MTTATGFTVTVPGVPDKQLLENALRGKGWAEKAKLIRGERDRWLDELLAAGAKSADPITDYPVSIDITIHGAGRKVDVPNWAASLSLKILVDCLTERSGYGYGIIVDDSVRYVHGFHVDVVPKGEPRTEITVRCL